MAEIDGVGPGALGYSNLVAEDGLEPRRPETATAPTGVPCPTSSGPLDVFEDAGPARGLPSVPLLAPLDPAQELEGLAAARQLPRGAYFALMRALQRGDAASTQLSAIVAALSSPEAGIPNSVRASILEAVASTSAQQGGVVADLVTGPAWESLSPVEKLQLSVVIARAGPAGRASLLAILDRPDALELLGSSDSRQVPLLANLAALARQPLASALVKAQPPVTRSQLLDGALAELQALPEDLAPGSTAATVQTVLTNPSEYVRLLTGLAGPTARVTTDAGGELTLPSRLLSSTGGQPVFQPVTATLYQQALRAMDPNAAS